MFKLFTIANPPLPEQRKEIWLNMTMISAIIAHPDSIDYSILVVDGTNIEVIGSPYSLAQALNQQVLHGSVH